MALDQATVSGWAFLIDDQVIAKGLINQKEFSVPYTCFRQKLLQLIDKFQPDVLIFEDLRSMRNAFTVKKLQQITGIIIETCESIPIPYYEYLTVSVRAKLCIKKTGNKGRGTKADLAHMICYKYNWQFPVDKKGNEVTKDTHEFFNISDAIGLGLYHYKYGK